MSKVSVSVSPSLQAGSALSSSAATNERTAGGSDTPKEPPSAVGSRVACPRRATPRRPADALKKAYTGGGHGQRVVDTIVAQAPP